MATLCAYLMARIIHTDTSTPADFTTQWERDQVYNGLDCCVTREVWDTIHPQLGPETAQTYAFSRALQGPVLEMNLRGILVDQHRKNEVIDEFSDTIDVLERNLSRIVLDGVGMAGFNWRSPKDLQALFYGRLQIPPITFKGKVTTDRAAREKLASYMIARPIVSHLNAIAELAKKISVLRTTIDPDGRIRTTYNIAGTNSGRFSSSESMFGTGTNLQNIEEFLRSIFIADPGMKWAKFDAKQIQSRIVGAIEWKVFKDSVYLDACESVDLHTFVAKLTWPNLAWSGDVKKDKAIAETIFYRHFTHRDLCKKLGHGSNFEGQPPTLSAQTGVPLELVQAFQPKYFQAFPCHPEWHLWVAQQIATKGYLTGITGRKRWFWGRRTDPETVRGAISYDPQNSEAFFVNQAMLNIWHKQTAIVMMQEHDALVYQYPEHLENEIVPKLLKELEVTIDIGHGRTLTIPYEAKVGWNRGNYNYDEPKKNPDGLKDYTGEDKRRRQTQVKLLDRVIRRAYR